MELVEVKVKVKGVTGCGFVGCGFANPIVICRTQNVERQTQNI